MATSYRLVFSASGNLFCESENYPRYSCREDHACEVTLIYHIINALLIQFIFFFFYICCAEIGLYSPNEYILLLVVQINLLGFFADHTHLVTNGVICWYKIAHSFSEKGMCWQTSVRTISETSEVVARLSLNSRCVMILLYINIKNLVHGENLH